MPRAIHGGLLMPRKVPSGVCFHPDGQAMRRRAESPTRPPSFGPRKPAGPKAISRMSAPSLPLVPYSFLAPSLLGRTLSRQTSHYKAFSAASPPRYQTHICTQGSSTPCPWRPSTGGRAASTTRVLLCDPVSPGCDGHFQYRPGSRRPQTQALHPHTPPHHTCFQA